MMKFNISLMIFFLHICDDDGGDGDDDYDDD